MKYKHIVVGAGFSGAVVAREIAEKRQEKVLLIEKRNHIGGNCFDYFNEQGILIHKYGPHIFHTNYKTVWDYLSKFTDWEFYQHKVLASIDGNEVNLPFNLNSLHQCFPNSKADLIEKKLLEHYKFNQKIPILKLQNSQDKDLFELSQFIYDKVFKNYTIKQWGLKPEEISPEVSGRVPVSVSCDNRYFTDQYQGLPKNGYCRLFENILDHKNIKIMLNTNFLEIFEVNIDQREIYLNGENFTGNIFYSGQIDELFNYIYGELPYRSLKFENVQLDEEKFQTVATVNYPNNYEFTRITEYKNFYNRKTVGTTISYEFPEKYEKSSGHPPYYPIFNDENQQQFEKYLALSKEFKNLIVIGRLAEYKYFDMDDAVENVLNKVKLSSDE